MDYQILAGAICFQSAGGRLYLDLLSDNTLRIYHDPTHLSPVLGEVRLPAHFTIEPLPDGYQLRTAHFLVKVSSALLLSFTTLEGKLLAEEIEPLPAPRRPESQNDLAAQEGHPVVGGLTFTNAHHFSLHEDERFYGLGDHISPRLINGNTASSITTPTIRKPTKKRAFLYKDFPFFLVKRGSLSFGFYVDNSYAKRLRFRERIKRAISSRAKKATMISISSMGLPRKTS
jgi:hypothetical protein